MARVFKSPANYVQGRGVTGEIGDHAEMLGDNFSLAIDLPVTLADIGVENPSRDQLDVVAEAACAADETIHNEPFAVQPAMVRDAIRTADGLGQVRKEQPGH